MRQGGQILVVTEVDYLALASPGDSSAWHAAGVSQRSGRATAAVYMKVLRVIGAYVRRGGAQSTSSMRVIIGEVVFSHNIDFHDRNEASMA